MIEIRIADRNNFKEDSMDSFNRRQEVTNVYRLIDGKPALVYQPFTDDWSAERKREKAQEILSGKYVTYCAFEEEKVVGALLLDPVLNEGRMIVSSLHVSSEKRRMGIGRKLFEAARAEAGMRHAKALYFSACSSEETINFYFAMGCRLSEHPIAEAVAEEPFDLQLECALPPRKEPAVITETERLFLREMTDDDYEALSAVLTDKEIMQHYPYEFDEARVRSWITRNKNRYEHDGFGLWAVCLKETGEMIGDCGLTLQPIDGQMLPEIGYHIRRDQQRKGYCREAASAVRDWAFVHTAYSAMYSYCKFTNVPSYKTAESIGMRFLKTYPDDVNGFTHVSAMTREEWLALSGNGKQSSSDTTCPSTENV